MNRTGLWIILSLTVAVGCHRHPKGIATVPPPAAAVAVSAAVSPSLTEAESAFGRGDFLSAAIAFETYFQSGVPSNEMDRIRFHFGVAQSLSKIAALEAASSDTFKQLIRDYPNSVYSPPAQMALSLQDNIVRLQADKLSQEEKIRQLTALIPPAPPVLPAELAAAESAYDAGDFAAAAKSYEVYLQSRPKTDQMDRILLRLGISQSLSGTLASEAASNETFKQLIRDFSKSPYAPSAGRVLALRAEISHLQEMSQRDKVDKIQKLTEELDKLKKIDSERRRTP